MLVHKPVNHTPNKRRGKKKRKMTKNHLCLPFLSLFYVFIEKTWGLNPSSKVPKHQHSFQAVQIPERPNQPDRVPVGFAHADAAHSAPDGPAGTSAGLSGAPRREGGFGWVSTFSLGWRLWVDFTFQATCKEVPNICTSC